MTTKKQEEKNCITCAWNGNKGVCDKYRIVPMSADGRGRKNCEGWIEYKRSND